MRSLAGSILQIPRYTMLLTYMLAMGFIFVVTAILSFPCWIVGQIKH